MELSRYIHLNPVKAGLVKRPEDYKWSSYSIYVGSRKDILVDTGYVLNYFGMETDKNRINIYRDFIYEGIGLFDESRDWLEENIKMKRFLCSKNFINEVKKRCLTPLAKKL